VAVARPGKGSVHERSPINFGALAVRDALLVEVALWGDDINVIRKACASRRDCQWHRQGVKNAYSAIDRMADRKYLGKCNHKLGGLNCPEELWVRPNAKDIRCPSCQYEHNVANGGWTCWRWQRTCWSPQGGVVLPRRDRRDHGVRVVDPRIPAPGQKLAYRAPIEAKRFRLGDLLTVVLDESERKSA
jgi:hypothetical protein